MTSFPGQRLAAPLRIRVGPRRGRRPRGSRSRGPRARAVPRPTAPAGTRPTGAGERRGGNSAPARPLWSGLWRWVSECAAASDGCWGGPVDGLHWGVRDSNTSKTPPWSIRSKMGWPHRSSGGLIRAGRGSRRAGSHERSEGSRRRRLDGRRATRTIPAQPAATPSGSGSAGPPQADPGAPRCQTTVRSSSPMNGALPRPRAADT